jgi:hypothetical protein
MYKKKQKSNAPLLCVLIMKNQTKLNHISIPILSIADLGNIIFIKIVRTLILALANLFPKNHKQREHSTPT